MISKFPSIYHLFISVSELLDGLSCSARDQISRWKYSLCSPRTLCWFVCGWNLIDFIAANLHFIREQEQKESPSCFYNCPCGTSTRSLCPSLFPAPVLSGGFVGKIWSLKKSRRASEYLLGITVTRSVLAILLIPHIYQQGRCTGAQYQHMHVRVFCFLLLMIIKRFHRLYTSVSRSFLCSAALRAWRR